MLPSAVTIKRPARFEFVMNEVPIYLHSVFEDEVMYVGI